MSAERVAEASVEADLVGRARRLASASVILGIFACSLPWVGAALFQALGAEAEWRAPFVARLVPISYLPFAGTKGVSVIAAIAALILGHLAIQRGGGTRLRLISALVLYTAAGLICLQMLRVTGIVAPRPQQGISLHWFLAFPSVFAAVAAFAIVHLAVTRFRRIPQSGGVIWRPVLGTLLGYFNIAFIMFFTLPYAGKWGVNLDMSVCLMNLRGIESALREYADENRGMFPPLSSQSGVLMFSPEAIPQQEDVGPKLTCPTIRFADRATTGSAGSFDDQSYFYLGYALRNDDAVEAFARVYREKIAAGEPFDEDLVVEDGDGKHFLHRLSKDVREVLRTSQDRFAISPNAGKLPAYQDPGLETDDVPILIERGLHHKNIDYLEGPIIRGAWILYLNDGAQFVEEGTWPLTEKTQRILAELAE